MSAPEKSTTTAKRLCLLIPLIAIGVIAPTACYYDGYSYPTQGQVYKASPYGSYSPRTQPYPYSRSSPYGYNDRHSYGGGGYRYSSNHEHYQHKAQAYQQAARQREQSIEKRRESSKEGWQYEDRNERRSRGAEESYEERKR
ncbi:MAG: hypothetical protein AAGH89_13250, partial [Verrucomicrobiota bacterium]